jgi:DnaK suppressor protein
MTSPPNDLGDGQHWRARLVESRASVSRRAEDLRHDFQTMVNAVTDVATDDEHDPEGHTIAWERQQIAALLS